MPKVISVQPDSFNKPNYAEIVQAMLKDRADVELASKTHVISLWRAIQRAGYWSWSYRTGEAVWRVRLSKEPTAGKPNPLIDAYPRTVKTQYYQWREYIPALLAGKKVLLPTKEEANRLSRSARYHLQKESTRPFRILISPDKGQFALRVVWQEEA